MTQFREKLRTVESAVGEHLHRTSTPIAPSSAHSEGVLGGSRQSTGSTASRGRLAPAIVTPDGRPGTVAQSRTPRLSLSSSLLSAVAPSPGFAGECLRPRSNGTESLDNTCACFICHGLCSSSVMCMIFPENQLSLLSLSLSISCSQIAALGPWVVKCIGIWHWRTSLASLALPAPLTLASPDELQGRASVPPSCKRMQAPIATVREICDEYVSVGVVSEVPSLGKILFISSRL